MLMLHLIMDQNFYLAIAFLFVIWSFGQLLNIQQDFKMEDIYLFYLILIAHHFVSFNYFCFIITWLLLIIFIIYWFFCGKSPLVLITEVIMHLEDKLSFRHEFECLCFLSKFIF